MKLVIVVGYKKKTVKVAGGLNNVFTKQSHKRM